jgi:hypothetical protein
MISKIHRGLGVVVLCLYVYLMTHLSSLLPGLDLAPTPVAMAGNKRGTGLLIILGLPLLAVACFLFPTQLKWRFSPRTPPDFDYMLTEGFWYLIGYVLLALSLGVLAIFRQPSIS